MLFQWEITKDHENYPWIYANKSGWMDSSTFYRGLEEWETKTRTFDEDGNLEPRLLIYDGHLSHIWYGTIELARSKDVSIIKLPAHTTDLLQPLDVSVFKSLKNHWADMLFNRLKTTRNRLSKAEFSTALSNVDCWNKAFPKANIVNGFRGCGIFPPNRDQYPSNRFHPHLKSRYDLWVKEGKPELSAEELDALLDVARKDDQMKVQEGEVENKESTPVTSTVSTHDHNGVKGKIVTFFVPDGNPASMERIDTPPSSSTNTPESSKKSFKDVALKGIEALQNNTPKSSKGPETTKRKRVNPMSELVTSDEKFQQILDEEKEKETKKKEKEEKKKQKEEKKKQMEKENVNPQCKKKKKESAAKRKMDSSSESEAFESDVELMDQDTDGESDSDSST